MSGFFITASSQRLVNSVTPITTVPFTVGCWVMPNNVNNNSAWSIGDTATTTNMWRLTNNSGSWALISQAGGASDLASPAGFTQDRWQYVLCRCITATNRRIAVFAPNGSFNHANSTTSRAPSGVDAMSIGSNENSAPSGFFGGSIAEIFFANADIQPGGAQLQNPLLRQLALGGPFSVPHIAKNIVEYRSLRTHPTNRGVGDYFLGAGTPSQIWTNTNGVTTGPHCPLPGSYTWPDQVKRLLVI